MSDWGGFSEAELRHLRSGGDSQSPPTAQKSKSTATKSGAKKALAARKTTKPKPKVAATNEDSGKQCEGANPNVASAANENKSTTEAIHASQPDEELVRARFIFID